MTLGLDGPLARRHRARTVGSGTEVLVMAHGFGTDQTAWRHIVPYLPDRYTVLLFDLPGAGPLLPADFDPEQYRNLAAFADDLLALLDEVGAARCTYVAHSVSGMIGVLAALEEPQRFERLILLNASPRYLNDTDYEGGFEPAEIQGMFDAIAANYQAWVAGFAPSVIGTDVPQAVDEFSARLIEMRPDVVSRIVRTIFHSDVRDLLPRLTVPTALIHSTADVAVPPAVGRYLNAQIAGSELLWIDVEGHLPHLSDPPSVRGALAQLLDR